MLNDQGLVKILDFGLAKSGEPAGLQGDETLTLGRTTPALTEEGKILGTVSYMSPEQAQGKPLDYRSDIFSFGTVLYEMVTGRRAFQSETKFSTLAAIVFQEPRPATEIVHDLPHELERALAMCLHKDPGRRFQNANDLRIMLSDLKAESDSGRLSSSRAFRKPRFHLSFEWVLRIFAPLFLLLALGMFWWSHRGEAERSILALTRVTYDSGLTTDPAISPDGKLLAYASDRAGQGNLDIWLQHVDSNEAVRLTSDKADDVEPAISHDRTQIAFRSERDPSGIYLVSTLGGEARLITRDGRTPRFSPDGKWIAYWVGDPQSQTGNKIFVLSTAAGQQFNWKPDSWTLGNRSGLRTANFCFLRAPAVCPIPPMREWIGGSRLFQKLLQP
jgi:serine/threonine protein kinase